MDALYNEAQFSVLFIMLGCILLFLEIFVPSGGILGILALALAGVVHGVLDDVGSIGGIAARPGTEPGNVERDHRERLERIVPGAP